MNKETWVVEGKGFSTRVGGILLVHCFIMMFIGFTGGFVWLIHLADNVFHILPLPRMEIAVPDQGELLRNAHVGTMMNAMYAMAIVLLSARLHLSALQARIVYYAVIATLWGNTIGYATAVYAPERGIQPGGDWPNWISYGAFYIAVIGVVAFTGICLYNAVQIARGTRG